MRPLPPAAAPLLPLPLLLFLFLLLVSLLCGAGVQAGVEVPGVAEEQEALYAAALSRGDGAAPVEWQCLSGEEGSVGVLNDDYCDCADGSDEPGTAACASHARKAVFYCENELYKEIAIPASRVGDGVCDCCDGGDEEKGLCTDTCEIFAEQEFERKKDQIEAYERGKQERIRYVHEVREEHRRRVEETEGLDGQLETLVQEHAKLQAELEVEEEVERKEQRAVRIGKLAKIAKLLKISDMDIEGLGHVFTAFADLIPFDRTDLQNARESYQNRDKQGRNHMTPTERRLAELRAEAEREEEREREEAVEGEDEGGGQGDRNGGNQEQEAEMAVGADGETSTTTTATDDGATQENKVRNWRDCPELCPLDKTDPRVAYICDMSARTLRRFLLHLVDSHEVYYEFNLVTNYLRVRGSADGLAEFAKDAELRQRRINRRTGMENKTDRKAGSALTRYEKEKRIRDREERRRRRQEHPDEILDPTQKEEERKAPKYACAEEDSEICDFSNLALDTFFTLDDVDTRFNAEEVRGQLERNAREQRTLREKKKQSGNTESLNLAGDNPTESDLEFWEPFLHLNDQCFGGEFFKYTYEVCLYKHVQQKESEGRMVRLGGYTHVERDFRDDSVTIHFQYGERCWNGPARSAKVIVRCAGENRIVEVSEPNTCEYQLDMESPAVCTEHFARINELLPRTHPNRASSSSSGEAAAGTDEL